MTGGPNGKAAEVLTAPPTAQRGAQSTDSIDDEADERKRFAELQQAAADFGHALRRTSSGYVLTRWTYSRHCIDLDTIAVLVKRMGRMR